jgi:hypothetical protein
MVLIKRLGFFRQGMHEQARNAKDGGGPGAFDGIAQKYGSQSVILPGLIDSQPPRIAIGIGSGMLRLSPPGASFNASAS